MKSFADSHDFWITVENFSILISRIVLKIVYGVAFHVMPSHIKFWGNDAYHVNVVLVKT